MRAPAALAAAAAAAAAVAVAAAAAPSHTSEATTSGQLTLVLALVPALVCCLAAWRRLQSNIWLLCAMRLGVTVAAIRTLPAGGPAQGLLGLLANREVGAGCCSNWELRLLGAAGRRARGQHQHKQPMLRASRASKRAERACGMGGVPKHCGMPLNSVTSSLHAGWRLPLVPLLKVCWSLPSPALQAMLLLVVAAVLPLPVRHHCWVTVLVLRSAHSRLLAAAWLQAAAPGGAGQCGAVAAAARLMIGAVVPGGWLTLEGPTAAQLCWMAHTWAAWVLGLALPATILAALDQHAAQLQHPHPVCLPPDLQATLLRGSARAPWPAVASLLAAARMASLRRRSPSTGGSRPASGAGTGASSTPNFAVALPPGISASDVSSLSSGTQTPVSSDSGGSLPASQRASPATPHRSSGNKSASGSSPRAPPRRRTHHQPWMLAHLQLAGLLAQWLTALLPVGALAWAALEVAVLFVAI